MCSSQGLVLWVRVRLGTLRGVVVMEIEGPEHRWHLQWLRCECSELPDTGRPWPVDLVSGDAAGGTPGLGRCQV